MPARGKRQRKAMGQQFLNDMRVAQRIVDAAQLTKEDVVLEVGPGTGVLTRRLAPKVGHLVAIEKDPDFVQRLALEFGPETNVRIIEGDATEFDYASLGPFRKIVANLPYSVSTPITFRLLPLPWELAILMYQSEFAERLVAEV